MSVYVDDVRHRFGGMIMCHMWADNLDELLAMADRIGVARKWIQGHPTLSIGKARGASWVHFDIAASKKALAIRHGAVLTDKFGPVEHTANLDIASGDSCRVDYGRRRLERVAAAIALSLQDYWNSVRLYLPHCRAEDIARAALLRLQPKRFALCDLRNLDDEGLAEEARARELAFQDVLSELARRAASGGDQDWDERGVAALLAQKRDDIYHVDGSSRVGTMPPPLFRMGYEWAALSIIAILEKILEKPSEDIYIATEFQHVGKGLYKPGKEYPSDIRRRAALDLIKEIEQFGQNALRGMFFRWKRKNAYAPADDAELATRIKETRDSLSGGLFQCASGGGV